MSKCMFSLGLFCISTSLLYTMDTAPEAPKARTTHTPLTLAKKDHQPDSTDRLPACGPIQKQYGSLKELHQKK